jgi:L-fucose isomerase-like protein
LELNDPDRWTVSTIDHEQAAQALSGGTDSGILIPLSGGGQPWIRLVCSARSHLALYNAYLPGALPEPLAARLLHGNAHPACTDSFAFFQLAGKDIHWLDRPGDLRALAFAWTAARRLQRAKLLKIGETEPWVINSCRDPEVIRERIGTEVVSLDREALYEQCRAVTRSEAEGEVDRWMASRPGLLGIAADDLREACRVTAGMKRLLALHEADGCSMACFAMIGDLDTTSCLALSSLNDSATAIGACEGDLDAALTLFLLKALGADFVWVANPILHRDNRIDLVHCTAPTCACGQRLPYKLMRHHESGRGVSPEVSLPAEQTACAARIHVNSGQAVCHQGRTRRIEKLSACHTQIELRVQSTRAVLEPFLGTHLVLSYGEHLEPFRLAARALGLKVHSTRLDATP